MNILLENFSLKKCNQLISIVDFYEKQIDALEMMLNDVIIRFTNKISFEKKSWYSNSFEAKKETIKLMKRKLEQNKQAIEFFQIIEKNQDSIVSNECNKKISNEVYQFEKEINELSKSLKYFLIDIL